MSRNSLRTALSNLRRNGLYAAVSLACLAVGLCAALVVAIYVFEETAFDAFVPGADRTVLVAETIAPPGHGAPYRAYPGSPSILPLSRLALPGLEAGVRVAPAEVLVDAGGRLVPEKTFAWADAGTLAFFKLKAVAGDPATALSAPAAGPPRRPSPYAGTRPPWRWAWSTPASWTSTAPSSWPAASSRTAMGPMWRWPARRRPSTPPSALRSS